MSDLADLYQELVLDHGTSPRNFREMTEPDRHAEGFNPLCGDRIRVFLKVQDGSIKEATFTGKSCAICTASASLMTQSIRGREFSELPSMIDQFRSAMTSEDAQAADMPGQLQALRGVRRFPMRVKCATLPWHTLGAAVDETRQAVTTE